MWTWVRDARDGSCGLVETAALIGNGGRTHWIDVSFAYEEKKVNLLLVLQNRGRESACRRNEKTG